MNDNPVKSQSSLYFERYALSQRRSMALGMGVYLLGGVCVVLAIGLVWTAARPKAVYYIPAAPSFGMAYPDHVPAASVASFAAAWLLDWINYTPETVRGVYERAGGFMSPELLARVRAGMQEEFSRIEREQVSSVFFLKDASGVVGSAQGFQVALTGIRAVYAGKEELSREAVIFDVSVRRIAPRDTNPYGLAVVDVRKRKGNHESR